MMGLPIERLESCDAVSREVLCATHLCFLHVQLPADILGSTCRNVYNFWRPFDYHLLSGIFKRLYLAGVANDGKG